MATVHVRWVLPWKVVHHGIMHSVYFSDPNGWDATQSYATSGVAWCTAHAR